MSSISIPPGATAPIAINGFVRNGKVPDDQYAGAMALGANQAMFLRGKEFFHGTGMVRKSTGSAIPDSAGAAGTRVRWRFYAHTSPRCKRVYVTYLMAQEQRSPGDGQPLLNPFARLGLVQTGVGSLGSVDWHYGATVVPTSDVPGQFGVGTVYIDNVPGSVDIQGTISEGDNARIVSCVVYEAMTAPDTLNGYLPSSFATQSPIVDTDRSVLETATSEQWLHGGAHILNWSVDEDVNKRSITTLQNVIDASTVVGASSPGFTVDMRNRGRYSSPSTVNCVLAAYANGSIASTGFIGLAANPSGTIIANVGPFATTPGWVTANITLPTTLQKLDLYATSGSGTMSLYAISLFERG